MSGGGNFANIDPVKNGGGTFSVTLPGVANFPLIRTFPSGIFLKKTELQEINNIDPGIANSPLDLETAKDNFLNLLEEYKSRVRGLSWRYVLSKWGWKMSSLTNAIEYEIKILKKRNDGDFFDKYISMYNYIKQSWDNIKKVSDNLRQEIDNEKWRLFQKSLHLPQGRWLRAHTTRSGLIEDVYETTDAQMASWKRQEKLMKIQKDLSDLTEDYYKNLEKLRQDLSPTTQPTKNSSPLTPEQAQDKIRSMLDELKKNYRDASVFYADSDIPNKIATIVDDMILDLDILKSELKLLIERDDKIDELLGLIREWQEGTIGKSGRTRMKLLEEIIYRYGHNYKQITTEKADEGVKYIKELNEELDIIKKELTKQMSSSTLSVQPPNLQQNPAEKEVGGVELILDDIEKYIQTDGSFKDVDLSLPLLSKAELGGFDPARELESLRGVLRINATPNDERLERYQAAIFQTDQFPQNQPELWLFSQQLCIFLEAKGGRPLLSSGPLSSEPTPAFTPCARAASPNIPRTKIVKLGTDTK